jgi:hypothetical protein
MPHIPIFIFNLYKLLDDYFSTYELDKSDAGHFGKKLVNK